MSEDKYTEWKESWRDEYLKWICGFANAQGGTLEIGRDNRGKIVGVPRSAKLLEDLPNKIRDILGIIPEIDQVKKRGKSLILIKIKPYKHPVNYKGSFYYRSGSTNQELRGPALHHFLLDKIGQTWDGVPVPKVSISSFDSKVITKFRRMAVESGRLPADIMKKPHKTLLEKRLKLKEEESFKRAAVLLFHPDPEKYIVGAYIKIGYFRSDSRILYHDEIHGDLFTQVSRTMELLLTKYLKALISYRGLYRVETYPMPETALREAVLNAVIHRDYSGGSPIQIRVYDNKVVLRNICRLPEGWTMQSIVKKNQSFLLNPHIAKTFFLANMVETWGHGIKKMRDECKAHGVPGPKIQSYKTAVCVEFKNHEADMRKKSAKAEKKTAPKTTSETPLKTPMKTHMETPMKTHMKILGILNSQPNMTIPELARQIARSESAVWRAIKKLQKENHLKRIGPAKGGHWKVMKK